MPLLIGNKGLLVSPYRRTLYRFNVLLAESELFFLRKTVLPIVRFTSAAVHIPDAVDFFIASALR